MITVTVAHYVTNQCMLKDEALDVGKCEFISTTIADTDRYPAMNAKLIFQKIGWVLLAGLACGAIVWGLSVPLTGMREPFDSPGYYYMAAMFIAGILATLPAPRYWWAAVVGIFLGERIYAFVMLPETRDWLLFGIYMGLLTLTWLPPALGGLIVYIVNRLRTRRSRGRA